MDPVNLFDFERMARERLTPMTWDYYASGSHDQITLRENDRAYDRIQLAYRVLAGVAERNLATTVQGHPVHLPILVAPSAFQCLACDAGELATVRAAGRVGTLMTLSTLSTTSVEAVVEEATSPLWFQLYVYRDRSLTRSLVERVEAAGCRALVVTVDAPLLGRRESDVRNRFHLPPGMGLENLHPKGGDALPLDPSDSGLASYFCDLIDPGLDWEDIDWLSSITDLPIILKGIIRSDDAVRAVEHGVAGIVVSNHGGRQLDTSPPTIEVLPEVVEAVGGRVEVYVDGGIRRGTDVIKALARGARAVMVGRPILWGLGAAGEEGAVRVLEMLGEELDLAMALCGCRDVTEITSDLIRETS